LTPVCGHHLMAGQPMRWTILSNQNGLDHGVGHFL
jgi:hypothetical protein